MFCAQCGQRIADGAKFCSHCGAAAPAPVAASPSPVEPAPPVAPPPRPVVQPPPPISPPPRPAVEPAAPIVTSAPRPAVDHAISDAGVPRAPVGPAASMGSMPPPSQTGGPADPLPRFDAAMAHGIFARIKGILLSPSTEWPLIAAEPTTAGSIYMGYVLPLVAIGVLATLLGGTLIGVSVPFVGTVRTGIIAAVLTAVLQFVFAFVIVWLISWLVDVLAPTFGGQRDSLRALKVTAYSYTPAWVAGIFHLIPMLGILAFVAGLYGLYLLYLGLPVLMRCPQDKSVGYTIVTVLCAIVMAVVIGVLSACAIGGLGMLGLGALGKFSSHSDSVADTTIAAGALSNMFGGKSDADRARVSDALGKLGRMGEEAERAEKAARASGATDPRAAASSAVDMNTALNAVGQIMTGGKDVQPVDFHRLKDMLPETIGGLRRTEASGQSGEAMGIKGSSATARYGDGANASVQVEITDLGSLSGLAGLAAKFDPSMEKETDTGYERTTKINGQLVHERYDRRARSGEVSVILNNRFSITVNGSGVDASVLTGALKELDVGKLATMTAAK
jgi:Yip1 domain/zinc-ribbon domain